MVYVLRMIYSQQCFFCGGVVPFFFFFGELFLRACFCFARLLSFFFSYCFLPLVCAVVVVVVMVVMVVVCRTPSHFYVTQWWDRVVVASTHEVQVVVSTGPCFFYVAPWLDCVVVAFTHEVVVSTGP